jgi:hypothetical protein
MTLTTIPEDPEIGVEDELHPAANHDERISRDNTKEQRFAQRIKQYPQESLDNE